jgi:protoporphyrinogen oxidase
METSNNTPASNTLTIIGAGATGLTAAYLAAKSGYKVKVIESSNNLGGLLSTFKTAGDQLEFYYHHFFTHDEEILWLLKELALDSKLFFKQSSMGVFRNGKIYPFSTPKDLLNFTPMKFINRVRFAASSLLLSKAKNWKTFEDISILDWFYKWAGKEATETVWKPMLKIKFGDYFPQIPASWMIGRLQQRVGSRNKGKEQLGYLLGSQQLIVDKLVTELERMGVEIIKGIKVKTLNIKEGNIDCVVLENGDVISADKTLSTIPVPYLSELLENDKTGFRSILDKIEYFGAICVVLMMKEPLSDTYWLNVADPGFSFGGVIEHTNFIPKERYGNQHIAYLSRYIEKNNSLMTADLKKVEAAWIDELVRIYPNFKIENIIEVKTFRTSTAAPVCLRNFSKDIPNVKTPIGGFYAVNMAHVYPDERSVNNSIRIAGNALKTMGITHDLPDRKRSLTGIVGF